MIFLRNMLPFFFLVFFPKNLTSQIPKTNSFSVEQRMQEGSGVAFPGNVNGDDFNFERSNRAEGESEEEYRLRQRFSAMIGRDKVCYESTYSTLIDTN